MPPSNSSNVTLHCTGLIKKIPIFMSFGNLMNMLSTVTSPLFFTFTPCSQSLHANYLNLVVWPVASIPRLRNGVVIRRTMVGVVVLGTCTGRVRPPRRRTAGIRRSYLTHFGRYWSHGFAGVWWRSVGWRLLPGLFRNLGKLEWTIK